MKWTFKRDIFALSMLVLYVIAAVYFYHILPDTVASHFNSQGLPDDFSSKSTIILIGCILTAGIYLLLTFIPFIDPFWKKIEKKYDIFLLFRDLAMAFMVCIFVISFISSKEGAFRSDLFGIVFGLLFVVLGNYLPRLPRNFFFGIRSPWTLASETVWYKTHRMAGGWFVVAGIILIILTLFKVNTFISMTVVLTPLVLYTAVIYPFLLYKKLQKDGETNVGL
jgi:uncharacterized membrane protein